MNAKLLASEIEYTPGTWYRCETIDQMEAFYHSRLPAIRATAKLHGYAIAVHGSARRDFDLVAVPWREDAADKDTLAKQVHKAACGFTNTRYDWEQKPAGRSATCFPICWCTWHDMVSAGHIDLSVIPVSRTEDVKTPAE